MEGHKPQEACINRNFFSLFTPTTTNEKKNKKNHVPGRNPLVLIKFISISTFLNIYLIIL